MEPRKISGLQEHKIIEIAAGPFHTLALTDEGKLFAFGNVKDDKLGVSISNNKLLNPDSNIATPQLV